MKINLCGRLRRFLLNKKDMATCLFYLVKELYIGQKIFNKKTNHLNSGRKTAVYSFLGNIFFIGFI